jgi:hypothetical protein
MRTITPEEKEQLNEIEAMIMFNLVKMAEWAAQPIKERLKQSAHIQGLVKRTTILVKCKKDFEALFNEPEETDKA